MGNAQLVAIGFAVAFSATGIGAPVGFLIGSMVGNMLFPPKPLTSEGPRLGDLNQSSSSFGAPRALGFGTVRQGGNVIWQLPIQEKKKTTTISGGKGSMSGSPDTKQTTYSYFGTWAQAFGEGEADAVLRIWFDGKIIYDKRGTEIATLKKGVLFRFYGGTETQLVDPAIEADKGVDQAPAFRGTCYIVFDDIPLADYGNRFPNVTAEIAYTATSAKESQVSTDGGFESGTWANNVIGIDWDRGFVYVIDAIGSIAADTFIRKFRLNDLVEVQQVNGLDAFVQTPPTKWKSSGVGMSIMPTGDIITVADNFPSGTNEEPIVLVDSNTLREKARFGVGGANTKYLSTGFASTDQFAPLSLIGLTGRKDYVLCGSSLNNGSAGVLEVGTSIGFLYSTDGPTGSKTGLGRKVYSVCSGKVGDGEATGYYVTSQVFGAANSTPYEIHKVTVDQSAALTTVGGIQVESGVTDEVIASFSPSDLFAGATNWNDAPYLVYDETDGNLLLGGTRDSPTEERMFKIDGETGAIIWTASEATNGGVSVNDTRFGNNSRLRGTTFGYIVGSNGYQINTVTGEVLMNNTSPNYSHEVGVGGHGGYDSISETFVAPAIGTEPSAIVRMFFNRVTDTGISVGTVVKAIADRTGLDSTTDLDTTSIDATIVTGYLIGRQSSARAAINPLNTIFFFDGFESDDKLKFVLRGGASVRTITQGEFATLDKNGQVIKESRTQEVELPERFSLLYLDKDNDYLQNAHNAKRIKGPTSSMGSNNELGLDFPGSLTATFAKQAAEKSLYTAWTERSQFQIKVPWTHLDLDPSDVITITLDNGQTLRARLVQVDVGADFSLDMVAVGEETQQFISTVAGDAGSGVPVQTIQANVFVNGLILDVPLLRDQDEFPARAANPMYAAMGAAQSGQFTAGTMYKSSDSGGSFSELKSFVSEMAWGTTINTLGNPITPWQTDHVNTVNVQMVAGGGDLVSVTNLEMLNGANRAAIFKSNGEIEIIGYQTVTLEANGSYTLSTLLRGLRGTDLFVTGHAAAEVVLILNPLDIEMFALTLGERNTSIMYRSVGSGQLFDNGQDQNLTSLHRALMPYTTQHHAMADGASSSTDFTWVRRTRVGGDWQNLVGRVPLSEDTEEYEMEIFDAPGGSIVRTVTGLTTPAYNYSSADQTTDGFTAPIQTATIKVYQISAQVGRGFAEEVTISV